jgi:hypothetical protein
LMDLTSASLNVITETTGALTLPETHYWWIRTCFERAKLSGERLH